MYDVYYYNGLFLVSGANKNDQNQNTTTLFGCPLDKFDIDSKSLLCLPQVHRYEFRHGFI